MRICKNSLLFYIFLNPLVVFGLPQATDSKFPDLYEASLVELQDGLESGLFTSVDLIKVSVVIDRVDMHRFSY